MCCRAIKTKLIGVASITYTCLLAEARVHGHWWPPKLRIHKSPGLSIVKKCPSSLRCWDLNPQPLERESLPITTIPGLEPIQFSNHLFTIFRLKGDDFDPNKPPNPDGIRIVISAPDKNIPLMKSDIAFMLVQYEGERDPWGGWWSQCLIRNEDQILDS